MKKVLILSAMTLVSSFVGETASAQTDSTGYTNFNDTVFSLSAVTVKSTLPKTRVKGDAMRTIVAGSVLETAGTASDALGKIPQLKAEKDGGVEVFGRGAAEVYVNGRKVLDVKELSRLQSDQIQYVDVIQNPGAKYAASTKAVVRIQLKKNQGEGWSFADYAETDYQYGWTAHNAFDVNYRTGGLDVSANLWAGKYGHYKSLQENDLTYYVGDDFFLGRSNQEQEAKWEGLSSQLQLNYQLDENHSFGAFYKFTRLPGMESGGWLWTDNYENGVFTERSESHIIGDDISSKHVFNAYYNGKVKNLGIDFNIDGLFDDTDAPNSTDETTIKPDGTRTQHGVNSTTVSSNHFIASKLVLTYPVWKGNLSVGGEYSHNNRSDSYSYSSAELLPVQATDSEIKETVASGFVEYGRQFGRLYAQVGLRYEHLCNDYYDFGVRQDDVCREYGDWFPTATLAMPIMFGNVPLQMSLSYRRDIERPAYSQLTSSTVYINRYTYQSGNPFLRPTYTHSLAFNAAMKEFNFTFQFARTKDNVTMITDPYPGASDPMISLIYPANGNEFNQFVFLPSYRPRIGKWSPMWSAAMVLQNYKTLCATGDMLTLDRPFFQFIWSNDIELPHNFRLNAYAQLGTQGDYGNYRLTKNQFATRVGIQKDFNLKRGGKLTLDLRCLNPFNLSDGEGTIYSTRELTAYNPSRRTIQFNVSWKLNEARSKYRGSGAGEKQKARMGGKSGE